jgi:hypothetical protein
MIVMSRPSYSTISRSSISLHCTYGHSDGYVYIFNDRFVVEKVRRLLLMGKIRQKKTFLEIILTKCKRRGVLAGYHADLPLSLG